MPSIQGPKGVMMLLERLEGILTWFRVCMVYSTTFSTGRRLGAEVDFIAETVGLMVELDPDLADLILRSKTTGEILLQAWSSRLTNDANPPSPFSTNQCPIIHLLAKFGDCEDGMEQLGARILSSRGRLASFGSCLLLRIAHTPVLARNDMTTTRHVVSATSCHILPLLISSMNLVQFPQIHRYLRKAGLLYHVARAVKTLQVCLTPADTYLVACYAIRLSYQSHANAVQGFTQVLEEGVLEVVIDAIIAHGERPIVPRGSSFSPNMLLRALSAFSYFPRTLKALAEAIERIPAAKWARLERMKSPVYPEAWGNVRQSVGYMESMVEAVKGYGITTQCDNRLHLTAETSSVESKVCSGCRNVVYCSEGCQIADWAHRHHYECDGMRHQRLARVEDGLDYTPKLRHLHTRFTWMYFLRAASSLEEHYHRLRNTSSIQNSTSSTQNTNSYSGTPRPTSEFIAVLDTTMNLLNTPAIPALSFIRVVDLDVYEERRKVATVEGCVFGEARCKALVDDVRREGRSENDKDKCFSLDDSRYQNRRSSADSDDHCNHRLIESIFTYNHQWRICVLAEMRRGYPPYDVAVWVPGRSFVRFEKLDLSYIQGRERLDAEPMGFLDLVSDP
ncbi:hypothetical protein CC2G_006633 [Coprinopsis cinerea AmutBmut pab1-1]|nr:hypothetical protein CC2G_006633 [Coprinopsis cinerea AmutBmut pab1-1]